jgi:diguanylate cyclase (GGDEF)-like protein
LNVREEVRGRTKLSGMVPRSARDEATIRSSLREAADLVNRGASLDTLVGAICDRMLHALAGREALVAIGEHQYTPQHFVQSGSALVRRDQVAIDPIVRAALSERRARCLHAAGGPAIFAPLRDDERAIGGLAVIGEQSAPAYGEDDLAVVETFAAYLSLAAQRAALKERARRLERLIEIDGLTGVANRRAFDRSLEREWFRSQRAGASLALVLMDVDHFKDYNDRYGHVAGDACLRAIARACSMSIVRASDLFARYGGEEFAVILADTDAAGGRVVAERIRATVQRLALPFEDQPSGHVSVSLGVASLAPSRASDPVDLIRAADSALYRAKFGGRNRVELADEPRLAR